MDSDEEVDAIIPPISTNEASTSANNSGRFQVLQDMNEDLFNSHVVFPVLNVEQTLQSAASAPSINESFHVIPPVEKEVVHVEVPKIKQKAKHISIIKTRNQTSGLVDSEHQIGKLRENHLSQNQTKQ